MPFRYDPDLQSSPTVLGNRSEHGGLIGADINNTSDVVAYATGKMYLFHSTKGALNLDNLVTGTPDQVNAWITLFGWSRSLLTERDAIGGTTGFPMHWHCRRDSDFGRGCLLVPIK